MRRYAPDRPPENREPAEFKTYSISPLVPCAKFELLDCFHFRTRDFIVH
jgi:hypothetical protein